MYAEALEILKDHHTAEDCVHEAIHKIIEVLPTFKDANDTGSLGGLVLITCRNSIFDPDFGLFVCFAFLCRTKTEA